MAGTLRSQSPARRPPSLAPEGAPTAAFLLDRVTRARVVDALRPYSTVEFAEDIASLLARVAAGPVSLVILECRDQAGMPTLAAVQKLRRGYPSIPIVAYTTPGRTASSDILAMAHAGVHELVIQGFDDVGIALRGVAESATLRCAARRILDVLHDDVPGSAVPFVQFCLERVWSTPTVTDAARFLGVHRKTLIYRLRLTPLPPPSTMIGWCRLFMAGHLLEDPRRSVAHVALALDFSSSAALRGMLRRYTGLRPRDVRAQGGLDAVVASFRRALTGAQMQSDSAAASLR